MLCGCATLLAECLRLCACAALLAECLRLSVPILFVKARLCLAPDRSGPTPRQSLGAIHCADLHGKPEAFRKESGTAANNAS
jgi:hypothetical protein